MNDITIFYSWQSDDIITKKFIDKSLPLAIKELNGSNTLDIAPRLDKDTQGVAGSPNIVSTIKDKIDACSVFVADVSLVDISSVTDEKLVNQNVMFELGYAVAKHTFSNVVLLFNSDNGDPKELPFDILGHRIHQFSIKSDSNGKKLKKDMVGILTKHLQNIPERQYDTGIELDEVETLIIQVLASMSDDKRILIAGTMGGDLPMAFGTMDDNLWAELEAKAGGNQNIIANLEELESKGILTTTRNSKGKPIYKPTKEGLRLINEVKMATP